MDIPLDPSDEKMKEAPLKCVKLKYTLNEKLRYLEEVFDLSIGYVGSCSNLYPIMIADLHSENEVECIQRLLQIPTIRNSRLPDAALDRAAATLILNDFSTQGIGPDAFTSMLQTDLVMIPRYAEGCFEITSIK